MLRDDGVDECHGLQTKRGMNVEEADRVNVVKGRSTARIDHVDSKSDETEKRQNEKVQQLLYFVSSRVYI
jgi:hypothetical protein